MTTTFSPPCSGHCLCAERAKAPESTRIFNASLEYEAGGDKRVEPLVLVVPAQAHLGEVLQIMNCAVRERIEPQGSHWGSLRFRLDGKSNELTFWQWVQDKWYRFTWRGKQHTGSHFVPIWSHG